MAKRRGVPAGSSTPAAPESVKRDSPRTSALPPPSVSTSRVGASTPAWTRRTRNLPGADGAKDSVRGSTRRAASDVLAPSSPAATRLTWAPPSSTMGGAMQGWQLPAPPAGRKWKTRVAAGNERASVLIP